MGFSYRRHKQDLEDVDMVRRYYQKLGFSKLFRFIISLSFVLTKIQSIETLEDFKTCLL